MKMLNKTKSFVFITTAATFFLLLCVEEDTFYLMPHWAPCVNKLRTSGFILVCPVPTSHTTTKTTTYREELKEHLTFCPSSRLYTLARVSKKSISASECMWILLCNALRGYSWGMSQMQVHHLQSGEDVGWVKNGPSPTENMPGEETKAAGKAAGEGQAYQTSRAVKQPCRNNQVPSQTTCCHCCDMRNEAKL